MAKAMRRRRPQGETMSAAAAETVVEDVGATSPRKKKKLVILIATAVLLAGGAGGGALVWKKKRAAAEAAANSDEVEEGAAAHHAARKDEHSGPPAFLPLDPFVVNLADRETERFAQIGLTLELSDPKFADQLKAYMPAIRNGVLLVLAHKTSQELLTRNGKEKLAAEIMREAVKPLGIELDGESEGDKGEPADGKGNKASMEDSPVRHVHFSSFIIQ
jgi:flagellar FliL protein